MKYVCDKNRYVTEKLIEKFKEMLICSEMREQTVAKYVRDIRKLQVFLDGRELNKELMIEYKNYLEGCGMYKISSINSYLAAANHLCDVMGWNELRVKMIKVQHDAFAQENREITQADYNRLIHSAMDKGDTRLALIIQTLGSTGIRISELKFITVKSLKNGYADIYNKGKVRKILYPSELKGVLSEYVHSRNIKNGSIFCTRNGKPIDRSNIWRDMKKLCKSAGVNPSKVFPHNMRHLFAKNFYRLKKDIARLADVLGHSQIETTRIYIKSTGKELKKQLDMMQMVICKKLSKPYEMRI